MTDRRALGLLAGLGLIVAVVGAWRGPGMWADDWVWSANRRHDGLTGIVGGTWAASRPVGAAVLVATWAPFGDHPVALYAVLAVLNLAVAVLLYRVARRWLTPATAMALAGVWLVLPVRSSLRMWPSTVNILAAVALALIVVLRMERRWSPLVALAAGLSYPAVCVAGGLSVLARRDVRRDLRLGVALAYTLGLAWQVWFPIHSLSSPTVNLSVVWGGHFGHGLAPGFGVMATIAVVAGSAFAGWRGGRARQILVVGWVLVAAGTVPFLRFNRYAEEGFADRSRAVSSIGVALIVCAVAYASQRMWTVLVPTGVAMLLVFASQTGDYRQSYDDALRWATSPTATVPVARDGVWSVGAPENASAALQYVRRDRSLSATPRNHPADNVTPRDRRTDANGP